MRFAGLAVSCAFAGLILSCDATGPNQTEVSGSGTIPSSLIVFRRERSIYTVRPDGSGLRAIAEGRPARRSGNLAFLYPKWSGDGQSLAYVRIEGEDPGTLTLQISRRDGSESRTLAEGGLENLEIAWAPLGERLAFSRLTGGQGSSEFFGGSLVYTLRRDGSELRPILPGQLIAPDHVSLACPSWSPDGGRLAFVDRLNALWTARPDGTDQRLVFGGAVACARWSPNGSELVFVRDLNAETGGEDFRSELFLVNSDGTNVRRLTEPPNSDTDPLWSPDGRRIAFQRFGAGTVGLYQMSRDGTDPVLLAPDIGIALQMTWSPDGSQLAFVSGFAGQRDIQIVNADGTGRRNLTQSLEDEYEPDWR
jgi:Tol biopolymer transport system component